VWESAGDPPAIAENAAIVPHRVVKALANRSQLQGIAAPARQRRLRPHECFLEGRGIRFAPRALLGAPRRDLVAGDPAEARQIGDAVAAEPVRAVHAARILAGDEEPG